MTIRSVAPFAVPTDPESRSGSPRNLGRTPWSIAIRVGGTAGASRQEGAAFGPSGYRLHGSARSGGALAPRSGRGRPAGQQRRDGQRDQARRPDGGGRLAP